MQTDNYNWKNLIYEERFRISKLSHSYEIQSDILSINSKPKEFAHLIDKSTKVPHLFGVRGSFISIESDNSYSEIRNLIY